jgi:hypothetical protein
MESRYELVISREGIAARAMWMCSVPSPAPRSTAWRESSVAWPPYVASRWSPDKTRGITGTAWGRQNTVILRMFATLTIPSVEPSQAH